MPVAEDRMTAGRMAANAGLKDDTPRVREYSSNDDDFRRHAYEVYARMREEQPIHGIVHKNGSRTWLVTRHEDVLAILKDPRFTKNYLRIAPADYAASLTRVDRFMMNNLLGLDPPDHTRLRALVQKAFSPRLIRSLRPRIQAIADELLDAVQEQGQMELIADYAFPLPIRVIAELLGIPPEDKEKFRRWSLLVTRPHRSQEARQADQEELLSFIAYLTKLRQQRLREPREDLLSALVRAEENEDRLSEIELYSMLMLLIVAGHETTVNLIGNGVLALLRHPQQLARLRAQPELIHSAIEELLRYDSPVESSTDRFALEEVSFGGHQIARGERVLVIIGSANRDCTLFGDRAAELDIAREENPHLAFGHGIHYCLGAALARMEGAIAIQTLLARAPNLRLAVSEETLSIRPSISDLLRGYRAIPVRWGLQGAK